MIELLEQVLGAPVVLEELKRKPGRRTTSRAVGARRSAIVKVYASKRAPTVAARIAALARGPSEIEVPAVLLCKPELHLLVLSEVPGVPLREAFLEADAGTCARVGGALGAWHRAWEGTRPGPLAFHTTERELEILSARIETAPAELASAVRAALEPVVADGVWEWPTVVHRDLYEEQIMVGERIGLIDLDDAALGPPELDIGNLLGHIDLLELRSSRDLTFLTETLLAAYRRTGPALDPALLARCRALTLLRLACIHGNLALLDRLPKHAGARNGPAGGQGAPADGLELLAERPAWLLAIADRGALEVALQRRVPEFVSGELELRECEVERVQLKGRSQTAFCRLTCTDRPAGHERVVEVLGENVWPGAAEPSPGTNGAPFGTDDWRCYVPELRLDLRSEPAGTAPPALALLTDPQEARALLEQGIRAGSPAYADLRIEACHPQLLQRKGARATVLCHLDFPPEDRGRGWPTPVVVKTYRRRDKCQEVYEAMSALWRSGLGESTAVAVAEPLAVLPDLSALVQSTVPGERTLIDLVRRALDAGTPEAIDELSAYVCRSAVGIAEVHSCGVTAGEELTWEDKLAEIRGLLRTLEVLAPETAEAGEPLLSSLETLAAEHCAEPPVPAHGSFRPNQVLLEKGQVGFVDFDGFCQAEPARDLALFRAALRDFGVRRLYRGAAGNAGERVAQVDGLCELFLASYEAVAPVSRVRVALWEALDLLSLVLYCWTTLQAGLEHRLGLLRRHLRAAELVS